MRAVRRVGRWLVAVAVLAGTALFVLAPNAAANYKTLDEDPISIASPGFDFGGGSFVLGSLSGSGRVEWEVQENDLLPQLIGELHLNDVGGECARMRIDYYTFGSTLLSTSYGGTKCAPDDGHHYWTVDLAPYDNGRIGKVKVTLQHELSNGSWVRVGSEQWSTLSHYADTGVKISTPGFDFGGTSWDPVSSNALNSGRIDWDFDDGRIQPHLTGRLYVNREAGACARMRIDYYFDDDADADDDPELLDTVTGGTVCASDNSLHSWTVDRADVSHDLIDHVRISIESLEGGQWRIVGSTFSGFGEGCLVDVCYAVVGGGPVW